MLAMPVREIIKHIEIQAYSDNCITSCEKENYLCHEQVLCSNSALSALLLSIVSTKVLAEVALILNEVMFMVSLISIYFQ